MRNRMKRLFATIATSTLLVASALVAVPASAQTGGEAGDNSNPGCYDVTGWGNCCPYYYPTQGPPPAECCPYYYPTQGPPPPECDPYYYYSDEPAQRPSQETAGQ
jgi:hypothetical protein